MELIILAVIGFAVGWAIGASITRVLLSRVFADMLKDLNVGTDQLRSYAEKNGLKFEKIETKDNGEESEVIVNVKIEEHHGCLYAFRKDDDKFLGQGSTREELIERISHEFSGTIRMVVAKEDGADLIKQTS